LSTSTTCLTRSAFAGVGKGIVSELSEGSISLERPGVRRATNYTECQAERSEGSDMVVKEDMGQVWLTVPGFGEFVRAEARGLDFGYFRLSFFPAPTALLKTHSHLASTLESSKGVGCGKGESDKCPTSSPLPRDALELNRCRPPDERDALWRPNTRRRTYKVRLRSLRACCPSLVCFDAAPPPDSLYVASLSLSSPCQSCCSC
jgi:hypothetical protein